MFVTFDKFSDACFENSEDMDWGKRLRAERERLRWTQTEMANALGMSRSHYANVENGQELPLKYHTIASELLGGPIETGPFASNVEIPLIGAVSAGRPADWNAIDAGGDTISVPRQLGAIEGAFAANVEGDSMFPLIYPGDLAVFAQTVIPRLGYVMLYRNEDGTATLKQVKHEDGRFVLHALNPLIEDEPVTEFSRVMGLLIGIIRHIGTRYLIDVDLHGIRP